MKLEKLINELQNNTYVMVMPSKVHGIGVFAIRDISKGCRDMFTSPNQEDDEWITVSKKIVNLFPTHVIALIENYCLYDDENYFIPEKGFKKMDLVNFLNHSDAPNIISINDGDFFEAICDIKTGEELFVDYGEIVNSE
jgi:hypothetical protein